MRMRAQNWTPIYLLVIIIIAIVLILAVIKPMFQSAAEYAASAFLLFR